MRAKITIWETSGRCARDLIRRHVRCSSFPIKVRHNCSMTRICSLLDLFIVSGKGLCYFLYFQKSYINVLITKSFPIKIVDKWYREMHRINDKSVQRDATILFLSKKLKQDFLSRISFHAERFTFFYQFKLYWIKQVLLSESRSGTGLFRILWQTDQPTDQLI